MSFFVTASLALLRFAVLVLACVVVERLLSCRLRVFSLFSLMLVRTMPVVPSYWAALEVRLFSICVW